MQDLAEWVSPGEVPSRTDGLISETLAKRLFRERETNGLEAKGAAVLIGRKARVHLPSVVDYVLGADR
jgi:hypothetical protein